MLNYTSASSASAAASLAARLESTYKISTVVVQADLGSAEGPEALIAAAKQHFTARPVSPGGTFQVDVLVHNAGVALNDKLGAVKVADFETTYRVNVLGPLLLTQAAVPYLPTDRSGRIVSLSSVSSSTGFVGQSVYGGSKAALEAMTRTWARELAERCTVNAINPGPVLTEMYAGNTDEFKRQIKGWIEHAPLMAVRKGVDADELVADAETSGGRPAYVEEIAGIVGMLCSPESAWCTGQVVSANGGMLML